MAVNPYKQDIDFAILALQDPAFNKLFVQGLRRWLLYVDGADTP